MQILSVGNNADVLSLSGLRVPKRYSVGTCSDVNASRIKGVLRIYRSWRL